MTGFSAAAHQFMAQALHLARRGIYTTMPNPRVGCVIVDSTGEIIGEGWHERAGEPHAEIHALNRAVEKEGGKPLAGRKPLAGATVYVTLEPCSHYGRTQPCAEALIKAGVSKVVAAVLDNNPLVAGRGFKMLEEAGIETAHGLMAEEAIIINEGFFKQMSTGLPFVRAKLAMSMDGRTAMKSGESQWITGSDARTVVQQLRAQSCAIVTGVGSILLDDSSLTVRAKELNLPDAETICQHQPLRVVLDSQLQTPASAKVIHGTGPCLIITTAQACKDRKRTLEAAGAEILVQPGTLDKIDLKIMLEALGKRQCKNVLLETGATLAGAMMTENLIDELVVFMAPVLMGSDARPLLNMPLHTMAEKHSLDILDIRAVGNDWKITTRPKGSQNNLG